LRKLIILPSLCIYSFQSWSIQNKPRAKFHGIRLVGAKIKILLIFLQVGVVFTSFYHQINPKSEKFWEIRF
jgi:hypothetical protein